MSEAQQSIGEKRAAEVPAESLREAGAQEEEDDPLAGMPRGEVRPDEDEAGGPEEGRSKLCILNAGERVMNKKIKLALVRNNIKFHKTEKSTRMATAIVYFDTKEDMEAAREALPKINNKAGEPFKVGDYIRGSTKLEDFQNGGDGRGGKRKKARHNKGQDNEANAQPEKEKTAASSTIPWSSIPYEEQLVKKQFWASMLLRRILRRLIKAESKGSAEPMEWTSQVREQFNCRSKDATGPQVGDDALKTRVGFVPGAPCTLDKIIASPDQTGYRNKCTFTIGKDAEDKVAVGFRVSSFKQGSVRVGRLDDCIHVPAAARTFAERLEAVVAASPLPVFDLEEKTGFWQTCTVRYFASTKSLLACLVVSVRTVADAELIDAELKRATDELVAAGPYDDAPLKSVSVIKLESGQNAGPNDKPILLHGEPTIIDRVDGLDFEVSATAFFQVNSGGAEVLFDKIREWAQNPPSANAAKAVENNATEDGKEEKAAEPEAKAEESQVSGGDPQGPVVFDVCCGTGTIGLCMARAAKHVVGVDMVEDGIKDARHNAKLNKISNTTFVASKIEDVVTDLLRGQDSNRSGSKPRPADYVPPEGLEEARQHIVDAGEAGLVAIVDPPRAGLHKRVIRELRVCNHITNLIYVSCDANLALDNFVDLCRREHGQRPGKPFRPVRAIPVDLFPHTDHCELIIQFEKITDGLTDKEQKAAQRAAAAVSTEDDKDKPGADVSMEDTADVPDAKPVAQDTTKSDADADAPTNA
ncbi:tRNA uracil54-C5-methyltransferase-like [Hondaea fermentalgiana]|uniref:tRNA uracil54-C5-methyltransferase-like n=1 Tax=Hondaea fermentalgiana TaxID=2315210 RepID=A0A2R5GLI4_9STRA|nr:tRNA uracil54-C5-methyltransferase-like [Hondaea fermentalgiana]|eukprot:GBG29483.1 tRNA uracil54-C5-methyltransferase-like [Hondaea fermentalgiana]